MWGFKKKKVFQRKGVSLRLPTGESNKVWTENAVMFSFSLKFLERHLKLEFAHLCIYFLTYP